MDVLEGKTKRYREQLTKLGGNKVLRSRHRAAMFVVSFANFKSRALSRDPSSDRVMPQADVRVRAQASTEMLPLNYIAHCRNVRNVRVLGRVSYID